MTRKCSFKEYITNRFYNDLFDEVSKYIVYSEDVLRLQLKSHSTVQFEELVLSNLDIKHVYIEDQPNMQISFDIVVDAEIVDKCDDEKIFHQWFKIGCFGDLNCELDDFQILSMKLYHNKSDYQNRLSDKLVPCISKDKLDQVAMNFVARYYPEALEKPMSINPHVLADRMSLKIQERDISKDCSVFGKIYFQDSEGEFYDTKWDKVTVEPVKAKTIFVDPRVYFMRNLGSVNNTIVHECVHWDKHRKAMQLESLFDSSATKIVCKVTGNVEGDKKEAIEWMEWQANKLAPRIQMPLSMFQVKAQELIEKYQSELQKTELVGILESVIDELAHFFEVSRLAAKIRMIDSGYYEARNVFIYIDGKYVQPFTYQKDAIKENQTFCIALADALVESNSSSSFKEKLQTGHYLYVESHFCLNDPKYIENNQLTEYARLHLDECCLVFDLQLGATNQYSENYHSLCFLNRDKASNIIFEAHFSDYANQSKVEMIAEYNAEMLKVLQNLPMTFSGTLDSLIQWSDMTVEALSETAEIDKKTIHRLRYHEPDNVSIETVVQLCIGMRLDPTLSECLLNASGKSLMLTKQHSMYRFLLRSCYTYSIYECNEMLADQNLKMLGRKNRGNGEII